MLTVKREYELVPCNSRKSFYGKAKVIVREDGFKFLKSYDTIVACEDSGGKIHRFWSSWSATTGRHIMSFCGLNKAEFMNLELESRYDFGI